MGSLGGGFVGTEFQQRFDQSSANDFQSSIQRARVGAVECDMVCGPVYRGRQDHSAASPEGMVGYSWNGDLLRYLYCLGFVDSPSPEYEIPGAEVC